MKIVYRNLLNLLSEKPSKELLSKKLFQLGHEHEIHGDIFDMELTPNRGDCLSLFGLARDLNPFFGMSSAIDIYEGNIDDLSLDFNNLSNHDCPNISFLEIEISSTPKEYRPYLESYFKVLGNNKVNFFTDISNYLLYELGQPTHCYDRSKISNNFTFENKLCDEKFKTVVGNTIELKGRNCVFIDNNKVINLAGVMGGESTSCSALTKEVLIECAYFNPESIIGKSLKYNINSDAAHRFERGVDPNIHEYTLRRFIKIVQDHTNIISLKMKFFPTNLCPKTRKIDINLKKINSILGTEINLFKYNEYLKQIGFNIDNEITVPSYRHDVANQNDLAEEIARLIGYNNIASQPAPLKINKNKSENNSINILRKELVNNGFTEVINFPFSEKSSKKNITIDNPLDSNKAHLRTNLKDSLIQNMLFNERRQKDSIKLFEIADIYTKEKVISQQKKIGIIATGRQGQNYLDFSKQINLKYLNRLFNRYDFNFAEISRNNLDTKIKNKIFYSEYDLSLLPHDTERDAKSQLDINFINYKKISEFPLSNRDFSFSINNFAKVQLLINYLDNLKIKNLKRCFMFDFYNNKKTNEVKIGYRFIFQSTDHTLSDVEINNCVKKILDPLLYEEGISIPGLDYKL